MRGLFFSFFFFSCPSLQYVIPTQGKCEKEAHNLSIGAKLELIKNLESEVLVARVCDEYGVKKQTVSNILKSKKNS